MQFNYQARTKEGEVKVGVVEASSREAALVLLQKYGFLVTYLEEKGGPVYARELKFLQRISFRDVVMFSRQLSIMFTSKITLIEALRILASQTKNPELKETIINISQKVESGGTFSSALADHPKIFSSFYVSMIRAGEASGKLAESLNYLAEHLEKEYYLKSKITGASAYPLLVLVVAVFVAGFMMFSVIPNMEALLSEGGSQMPAITRAVINFSNFLKRYGIFLLLGISALIFLIFRYSRTAEGKEFFDKNLLNLPFFSSLLKTIYISRFAENLSTLLAGGLLITNALDISADIVGNSVYRRAIISTSDDVRKGIAVSSGLSLFPEIFPPIFIQMTMVGEKTGTLGSCLKNIADFYSKEVERSIDNLLSLLEPVLIIILGGVVGGIMLSVLLPLYQGLSV